MSKEEKERMKIEMERIREIDQNGKGELHSSGVISTVYAVSL